MLVITSDSPSLISIFFNAKFKHKKGVRHNISFSNSYIFTMITTDSILAELRNLVEFLVFFAESGKNTLYSNGNS